MIEYVLAVMLAVLVAPYLHEGSHWFIGWIGNTKPRVAYVFWIIPNGVHHEHIKTIDSEIIRASGLAPFFWAPVAFFAIFAFLIEQSPTFLFAAFSTALTILMSTESDAIAFREPEKYRESEINGELSRNPLLIPNPPGWIPRF